MKPLLETMPCHDVFRNQSNFINPKYFKNSNEFCTSLFLGQGNTENFCNFEKDSTFKVFVSHTVVE